jgi:prepilin-type N-terminal cleavage/methylation domain-containing protein
MNKISLKNGPSKNAGDNGFTLIELLIYIAIFGMIAATLLSLALVSGNENSRTTNDVINAYENK